MNPYIQYMYSYPHKTAYRQIRADLRQYVHFLKGGGHELYLHIPFCQARCGYCNLFSVAAQGREAVDRYLDAVERQSGQYREILWPVGTSFSGLTIGGGTPLYLTAEQLERMFCILENHFSFDKARELVVETAPNQTTAEKLAVLKRAGTTRISLGIQSFSDEELTVLKRQHNGQKAREALERIRAFEFPCVNMDFIYGIPGQTCESLLDSLREALDYEPDEIFLYPLYVKQGVGMEREGAAPKPEEAFRQYEQGSRFLADKGFRQDSMRRFVRRRGKRRASEEAEDFSQGERAFCECGFGTSLALGCGGRSYLGNLHFCTPYAVTGSGCRARLEEYECTEDFSRITNGILLSEEEQKRRYVIRHLLIRPGLLIPRYRECFGTLPQEDFPILEEWVKKGFARAGGDGFLELTDTGLGLSDFLGPKLISPEIRKAMDEWVLC
ncbi:MAG: STM4012 family radical SAM protein [Acetatifactor sp.]|nr:STM4012 family radical SAM protein [Acetatifactor sp.]